MTEKWQQLADEHGDRLKKQILHGEWKRLHRVWGAAFEMDYDEIVAWGKWLKTDVYSEPEPKGSQWEHDRPYWFDDSRDVYIVHLPSRKRPFAVPGDTWAALREAYSNWDG